MKEVASGIRVGGGNGDGNAVGGGNGDANVYEDGDGDGKRTGVGKQWNARWERRREQGRGEESGGEANMRIKAQESCRRDAENREDMG